MADVYIDGTAGGSSQGGGGGNFIPPTGTGLVTVTGGNLDSASTSVAAGILTFFGSPSSANLLAALTDETGSGSLVFQTSPTFKTSLLLNNPANTFAYTFLPSAITANRTLTLPLLTANDTLVTLAASQTLTSKTLTSPTITSPSFGSSNLITTGYLSVGASPSTTGDIRGPSGFALKYNVGGVDRPLIQGSSGAQVVIGGWDTSSDCAGIINRVSAGGSIYNQINGVNYLTINETLSTHANPLALGTNPAQTGILRLPSGGIIKSRDAGNTADKYLLSFQSNILQIGTDPSYTDQVDRVDIYSSAGGNVYMGNGGLTRLALNSGGVTIYSLTDNLTFGYANAASQGKIRLPGGSQPHLFARNNANNNDIAILGQNISDEVFVGTSSSYTNQASSLRMYAASNTYLGVGSSTKIGVSSSAVSIQAPIDGGSTQYGLNGVGTQAMADANQTVAFGVYCYNTIKTTGALTANRNLILPAATDAAAYTKIINNTCSGAFGLVVSDGGAGTSVTVANGSTATVLFDSRGATLASTAGGSSVTFSGDLAGTSSSQTVTKVNATTYPAGGALVTGNSPHVNGTSSVTYSALNLAGGSGWVTGTLPVANGGTGITSLGTGVATFLGTPTSANLAAALTDETGTGAVVFATSPTFRTSVLVNNPANTFAYTIAGAAITANYNLSLPLISANDSLVGAIATQNLSNKTLVSPVISTGATFNTASVTTNYNAKIKVVDDSGTVSSSSATGVVIYSWTLPNGKSDVDFMIQATTSTFGASYKRSFSFFNNAGTITTMNTSGSDSEGANPGLDVSMSIIGNAGSLIVYGLAATNITWGCTVRRQECIV